MLASDTDRASCVAELAVLVDLEARWENLRASRTSAGPGTLQDLQGNQRAYEVFHARLVAYNKRYAPPHIPELLVNTPLRLELWCKKMATLFAELGGKGPLPAHLLEKAYRLADGVAARKGWAPVARPTSAEPRSAAEQLNSLAAWCASLAHTGAAA